jgi:hypothetical protein
MKPSLQLEEDMDFGFSAVSEAELKVIEKQLLEEVEKKADEIDQLEKTYKEKLNKLYKMIIPLLNNLAKDPDKEYILWPNRVKKIEEFRKKIDKLVQE